MDKLKAFFTSAKGKWFLAAAGVVAIIAFFVLQRKRASAGVSLSEYPTFQGNKDSGKDSGVTTQEVQQMVGELSRDMGQALKYQAEQNVKISDQFNSALSSTQSAFAQMFQSYTTQNAALLTGLTGKISSLEALNAQMSSQLLSGAQGKMALAAVTPIYDDTNLNVYGSANPYPGDLYDTLNGVTPTPFYGVGGANYNDLSATGKKAMEDNIYLLQTNAAHRANELEKANTVIANRQAAGLDTSEQEEYIRKINEYAQKAG